MAAFVVGLVLLLAIAGHSDASYCVCNTGVSDSVLQKNIDYACGNGADCSAILQNGPCYNPNTVKDHCNYAVNSYYQRKGQMPGSCDFSGTATVTQTPPNAASGCVYQSSPSNGGSTTPPTNPTTPTTPTIGGTPPNAGGTPNTPNTGVPAGGTPITGTGGTTPGAVPGSTVSPAIGLGPTGSVFGNTDSSASETLLSESNFTTVVSFYLSLLVSGLMWPRI